MRTLLFPILPAVLGLGLGCSPSVETAQPETTIEPTSPTSEPAAELELVVRAELDASIRAMNYEGGFVLFDPSAEQLIVSDPELLDRGFIPASTFKIPNSLIALETKVADSGTFALEWDGVERWNPDWNRDLDLQTAFEVSGVWFYQELARRIGAERMQEWLTAAEYGNADISGPIDMFWLSGSIRISPRQQVEFLHRLDTGASPFSPATVTEFFSHVMVAQPRDGGATIQAKTGTASASDLADPSTAGFGGTLGWYVGIVDRPSQPSAYFALVLFTPEPWPEGFREDRIALADTLLAELGYL